MKTFKLLASTALVALTVSSLAMASELKVDSAHSSISFEVKHLVVATVHGSFTDFDGTINQDEKDMTKSTVNFTVKADSINTANAKRDEHLKSADFFDVQKFPEAKFVSTTVKKSGKDKYQLEGDLTIHGVTKKAKFDVHYLGKNKDPWGTEKTVFQASTEFDRKDFGLTWNKTLEKGGVLVGEKVKLIVELETAPPKAKE